MYCGIEKFTTNTSNRKMEESNVTKENVRVKTYLINSKIHIFSPFNISEIRMPLKIDNVIFLFLDVHNSVFSN